DTPAVWVDPEHGVVRFIRRERLPRGEGLVYLTFSEQRPLAGAFAFPHRQEAFVDGKLIVLIAVRSIAVNTNLPDSLFDPETLRRDRCRRRVSHSSGPRPRSPRPRATTPRSSCKRTTACCWWTAAAAP